MNTDEWTELDISEFHVAHNQNLQKFCFCKKEQFKYKKY